MKEKKKISFKKPLRIAFGVAVGIIFLVTLIAASKDQSQMRLNGDPVIHLNDENEFSFLQKKDIKDWLLNKRNIDLSSTTLEKLDLRKIEKIAETNPWVAEAEVYLDNQNKLHIDITQRSPIARVFEKSGISFYLDSSKHEMPISFGYTYPSVVFTNVPNYKSAGDGGKLKSKIAYLGKVISSDSFWNAQITQIEVQDDQTFIASPLLGNQKIILGDTNDIQEKLSNLFAFYKNVASEIGWNTYDTYDLRFKGQVVASPTLGKSPPKVAIPKEGLPTQDTLTINKEPLVMSDPTPIATKAEPKKTDAKKESAKKIIETANKPPEKSVEKPRKEIVKAAAVKPLQKEKVAENKKEDTPKYIYKGK